MESQQKLKDIFSKNLKRQLSLHHKTQADLCNHLGYTSSTVSDWANAKKYPRMDKVQQIRDYTYSDFIWDLWAFLGYFGSECA